jgi:diguanylate cyclase (GGDEF)-like protein
LENATLKLSAHYEPLTRLSNRSLSADRIQQAVVKSLRNKKFVAIVFIDLVGFKIINNSQGHNVGDELLKKVAHQLKHVLREAGTLSRIDRDEFVVVIGNLSAPGDSKSVVLRMLDSVSATLVVQKKLLKISVIIGITFYPLDSVSPDQC